MHKEFVVSKKHIIFGAGSLGQSIIHFLPKNDEVILVNRSGTIKHKLPQHVSIVALDATNAMAVSHLCHDADVVYHCAVPPYHQWKSLFQPLSAGILQGVSQTHATLIYADNLYMYGDTDGQEINEDSPNLAEGKKGVIRMEMADNIMQAHKSGHVKTAIARASNIYGPNVIHSVLGEVCFGAVLKHKTVNLFGNIDLLHSYTYIMDFARVMVILGQDKQALGQIWHAPNAPIITTRDFMTLLEKEFGENITLRATNRHILALLGLFSPLMREFKEMMYEFEKPYLVNHEKFQKHFDFTPTPFEQGIKETMEWWKSK